MDFFPSAQNWTSEKLTAYAIELRNWSCLLENIVLNPCYFTLRTILWFHILNVSKILCATVENPFFRRYFDSYPVLSIDFFLCFSGFALYHRRFLGWKFQGLIGISVMHKMVSNCFPSAQNWTSWGLTDRRGFSGLNSGTSCVYSLFMTLCQITLRTMLRLKMFSRKTVFFGGVFLA